MDIQLMAEAIRDIQELEPALAWLKEYGGALVAEDRGSFQVHVVPVSGSACPGAAAAKKQLDAVARLHIRALVQHAIEDAQNTIQIRRDQIACEARA